MSSSIYEAAARGWCALRSPDPSLEPQDGCSTSSPRETASTSSTCRRPLRSWTRLTCSFVSCLQTARTFCLSAPRSRPAISIKEEAERAGAYYVNARWLGGMLTNFKTIRRRIDRLAQLRKMEEDGTFDRLPKKEVVKLEPRDREAGEVPGRHQGDEQAPWRSVHR